MTVNRIFAFGLLFALCASSPATARHNPLLPKTNTIPPRQSELSRLWHEAGMAYTRNDLSAARDTYRILLQACARHQTPAATWYTSAAEFGIARISSRLRDTVQTRLGLLRAMKAEFWTFETFERDSIIRNVAGTQWFDSLLAIYKVVRQITTQTWTPQEPLVIVPANDPCLADRLDVSPTLHALRIKNRLSLHSIMAQDSVIRSSLRKAQTVSIGEMHSLCEGHPAKRCPAIVALHGGCASYREFSQHWCRVADSLGVFVLVPAGTARFSEDLNSWDGSIESIDESVSKSVERFVQEIGYRPELYIAGFSQGAMSAIKIGLMHPEEYHGVIAVAGLLDMELPQEMIATAAQAGLCIYAMSGEFDSQTFRSTLELAERQCDAAKLPFHLEILPGTVHEVPANFVSHFAEAWGWMQAHEPARLSQSLLLKNRP